MSKNFNDRPTLRRSQTVTTFGVGSIVDLPEASAMICGIDKWDTRGCVTLNDTRLEEKLRVSYFYMPPGTEESADGVPAVRFPRQMRCRKCKRLDDLDTWRHRAQKVSFYKDFDKTPWCDIDKIQLIPSRFVVACRLGHIDDFPFNDWVHKGVECKEPALLYTETAGSVGLAGIKIKCSSCPSARTMAGSFNKEVLEEVARCNGAKPWEMIWSSECGNQLVTLQRGGTNVHFPILKSSILIPPYKADGLKTKILNSPLWSYYESQEDGFDVFTLAPMLSQELKESIDEIKKELQVLTTIPDDDEASISTEEEYRFQEYQAFTKDIEIDEDFKKDFLIERVDGDGYGIPMLKNLILAKRLREIRVQTGFSRIKPPSTHDETGQEIPEDDRIEPVSVSENKRIHWYPGYEVRGEGIFLEFDYDKLHNWAKTKGVEQRVSRLLKRSDNNPDYFGTFDSLSTEFVTLHSLAHALIKQLSFECGYSSSALRERIYCSSSNSLSKMAGILIYTAEGDSDGTMGGLVRQGRPDLFKTTFKAAIKQSEWCSSDPLCIESEAQGFLGLNLAACHACSMLPETSCESLNRYLDRGLLIGDLDHPDIGLFSAIT